MKTIYKYTVPIAESEVEMPQGAQILSAELAAPRQCIFVWAVVDTDAPLENRRLAVRGTGNPLDEVGAFIGTVQDPPYVWHVFEGVSDD